MNLQSKIPTTGFCDFVLTTDRQQLDLGLFDQAKSCLLDLLGIAASGRRTDLSRIIHDHAAEQFGSASLGCRLIFDARSVSPTGAALAGGMTIDSVDAHDGLKPTKGHVGCGLLPSLLAMADATELDDGAEFLTRLILGYEIGSRAGIALHASTPDYHTSGAWIAIACAALGARALELNENKLRHAIGIAEYHGPRSQMMRVIDHPTMLKDGSGFGAMAGTSAAFLARDGFTGAPAITVEGHDIASIWADLGKRWYIQEQYVKFWPVCRWAQPAVEAALTLADKHQLTSTDIEHVKVSTFHEAKRLAMREPATTEEAQYALPWPVAAALVRGQPGLPEILPDSFDDEEILRLSRGMRLQEEESYNNAFPMKRIATVTIRLKDGTELQSESTEARGDPEAPATAKQVREKFFEYAGPVLGQERSAEIAAIVEKLEAPKAFLRLQELIYAPVDPL